MIASEVTDLPQPDSPTRPSVSPLAMSKLMPETGVMVMVATWLVTEPAQFAEHPVVVKFLQAAGSEGLPLTLVDDVTVLAGRHPRRDELERYAGLNPTKDAQPQGGCCGPQQEAPAASTGCCGQPATTSTVSGCC